MKRWTNGLPGATKRLGAMMALRGLSLSQPRMRADTHDGPEQIAPLQRPDTLMQLSRSLSWKSILYRTAGPYILAQSGHTGFVRFRGQSGHRPAIAYQSRFMSTRPSLDRSQSPRGHAGVLRRDFGLFGGLGFGLDLFDRRGPASCAAVAVASACLRAMAARHFAGWPLSSARHCRFSAPLSVASYARRARAS